jgi:hypothetical protein
LSLGLFFREKARTIKRIATVANIAILLIISVWLAYVKTVDFYSPKNQKLDEKKVEAPATKLQTLQEPLLDTLHRK